MMTANTTYTNYVLASQQLSDRSAIGFYLVYAVIATGVVIWLARTLLRSGQVFLADVFEDDGMAEATNHLLIVGFYLLNLGYALTLYKVQANLTLTGAFNGLVSRIGVLLLSLGIIHLFNMLIFWRIRNHRSRYVPKQPPAPTYASLAAQGLAPQPAPPTRSNQ